MNKINSNFSRQTIFVAVDVNPEGSSANLFAMYKQTYKVFKILIGLYQVRIATTRPHYQFD